MPGSLLAGVIAGWRRLLREISDSYRPDLHYMRGPGPKCRAKARAHS